MSLPLQKSYAQRRKDYFEDVDKCFCCAGHVARRAIACAGLRQSAPVLDPKQFVPTRRVTRAQHIASQRPRPLLACHAEGNGVSPKSRV